MAQPVAVIFDIVQSRRLVDRTSAQKVLVEAMRASGLEARIVEEARATVGDEFQAVYGSLSDALATTLRLALALPEGLQVRAGMGAGATRRVGDGDRQPAIFDGPGWWNAREAVEIARANEHGRVPASRSWFISEAGDDGLVNAYLLARDQLIYELSHRGRRIAAALLAGQTQRAIAASEGISDSAVSKAVRTTGIRALVNGLATLQGVSA